MRFQANRESPSFSAAARIREAFQAAKPSKVTAVHWQWPKAMQEVGECVAIMYASNKWQKNANLYIDYKHNREGPQRLHVRKGFLRQYGTPDKKLPVDGDWVDLNRPMPDAFAVLAPILGLQARLYHDNTIYQINIAGAKLGAAVHPETEETFLFVYTADAVHCLITGDELGVEKDGIVG